MPFPESIKLEPKKRAHFCCVICHQPFVEVHHIIPEALGGPDTLENAAPLCGTCHDLFGGNPDKRKQIREMRDFWWEFCEKQNHNPDLISLNQKLDTIQANVQSTHISQTQLLTALKDAFVSFHTTAARDITLTSSLMQLSGVTGVHIPGNPDSAT